MHPTPARRSLLPTLVVAALCASCAPGEAPQAAPASDRYEDLVDLYEEWRDFERPGFVNGVPDYTAEAMGAQQEELGSYFARLDAIDESGWSVEQQIDHMLVRAEMNGLDFDHRVRRPWARNPAFYTMLHSAQSDVPAHEGPVLHGWIDTWTYEYPLSLEDAGELADRFATIPGVLDQAQGNLVEDARDLWLGGIRAMRGQSAGLEAYAARVAGTLGELDAALDAAKRATDDFVAWLEQEAPSKTGPSGVGRENYTWYLRNVHLVPWSWEEQVTLIRHELARSHASLRLEENRNRDLPPLTRVQSAAEYDRIFNAAVDEYVEFLEREEIVEPKGYMAPALRERIGSFSPSDGLRGFFSEVSYRNALTMRTHGYHWIELAMMRDEPHASPIRRVPSLYNIFDARSEGVATGMEEWSMHAGLFDDEPRARELIWILLAQRAARAYSGLMLHANEYTMDDAVEFAGTWTPRGWMPADSETVIGEQYLYLQQPGYGTSYLVGKIEVEKLMAEYANQLGDDFTVKRFFDDFSAAGVIPVSLIRWQLTGDDGDVAHMRDMP